MPLFTAAAPALLLCLLCASAAARAGQNATTELGTSGLAACAEIADDVSRLACYDALAATSNGSGTRPETPAEEPGPVAPPEGILVGGTAPEAMTLPPGRARQRMRVQAAIADLPWAVLPYHRNYLLPLTWNESLNRGPWEDLFPGEGLQQEEAKFQISFKALAVRNVFGEGTDLWAAYTQESWWQVYNQDLSSPFRETNYQPEIMFTMENDETLLGFTNTQLGLSFNHQSNGRSQLLSRSWNRVIASADFERNNTLLRLRAWYRVPESRENDDNPSVWNTLGYGDATVVWRAGEHEFSIMARNNLRSGSETNGALQVDWTFPISRRFRGYVQYFNGYGESLIDYDARSHRIGIGIALTDLL